MQSVFRREPERPECGGFGDRRSHGAHLHVRFSHPNPRPLAWVLSLIGPTDGLRRRDNLRGPSNWAGKRFRSEPHAVDRVERDGFVRGARDCARQCFTRIGEDLRIVAGAAERDVKLLAIDQFAAARGVDVDENAIDRGTLAGMGGNGIAVVEMRKRLQVQLHFPLTAEPERRVPASWVERCDGGELPVGDAELPVG